jgi:dihydrofolate synthase/folylpolyglutamate synthase
MRGAFQSRNLVLAVLGAEILRAEQGIPVGPLAVERGAQAWRWPGRCEVVTLPDGREVLLDAGHNEDGIACLRRELDAGWPGGAPRHGRPWRLIYGALDDKPAAAMLREISVGAERVVLVRPPSPRAIDPRELVRTLPAVDCRIAGDTAAALDAALGDGGSRVVVCGSIFLVGEVRGELRRRFGVPERAAGPWGVAVDEPTPQASPPLPAAGP